MGTGFLIGYTDLRGPTSSKRWRSIADQYAREKFAHFPSGFLEVYWWHKVLQMSSTRQFDAYRGSFTQTHLTRVAFAITKATWLFMNQQRREINKAKQDAPSGLDLATRAHCCAC